VGVGLVERVAAVALGLCGAVGGDVAGCEDVVPVGEGPQVVGVHARAVAALVVDVEAVGYRAVRGGVGHVIGATVAAVEPETGVSVVVEGAAPLVARTVYAADERDGAGGGDELGEPFGDGGAHS
jgi:hypothetical protein